MCLRPPQRMKNKEPSHCHSEPRPLRKGCCAKRGRRAERSGVKHALSGIEGNLHLCSDEILRCAQNDRMGGYFRESYLIIVPEEVGGCDPGGWVSS